MTTKQNQNQSLNTKSNIMEKKNLNKLYSHLTLSVVTGANGKTKEEFILLDVNLSNTHGMYEKDLIENYGAFGNFRKSRMISTPTHTFYRWKSSKSSIYYIELW